MAVSRGSDRRGGQCSARGGFLTGSRNPTASRGATGAFSGKSRGVIFHWTGMDGERKAQLSVVSSPGRIKVPSVRAASFRGRLSTVRCQIGAVSSDVIRHLSMSIPDDPGGENSHDKQQQGETD
jgi:hypothetical protein